LRDEIVDNTAHDNLFQVILSCLSLSMARPSTSYRDSSIDAILGERSPAVQQARISHSSNGTNLDLSGDVSQTEFQKGNDNVGLKGGRVRMRMVWQVFKAKVLDHDGLVIVTGTFRS
jgi:hypothetical protein